MNFQDLGKPTGELKIMEMHNYSLREDVTQQSGLTFGSNRGRSILGFSAWVSM